MIVKHLLKLIVIIVFFGGSFTAFADNIRFCVSNYGLQTYSLKCIQFFPNLVPVRITPTVSFAANSLNSYFWTAKDHTFYWSPNRGFWSCSLWDSHGNQIIAADPNVGAEIDGGNNALINIYYVPSQSPSTFIDWNVGPGICQ